MTRLSSTSACALAVLCIMLSSVGIAAAGEGYIGMSLPADFRAFSSESPWNTPVPQDPDIDPFSDLMIYTLKQKARHLKGDMKKWTIPLFVINSKALPKVDVPTFRKQLNSVVDPDRNRIAEGLPVPEGVWPDPESDGHMLLVDPGERKTWDFSIVKKLPGGKWSASRIYVWDLNGPGYREAFEGKDWWLHGARGAGTPLIAGLIRPEEIESGSINHALAFASPVNRKAVSEDGGLELCSPPASRSDGHGIGFEYIPEGARLQLDPALDLEALNLSPATKVVARAMQKYGMYNVDNAKTFKIYFQNLGPDGGRWKKISDFSDLGHIPVESFRVLKCNLVRKL